MLLWDLRSDGGMIKDEFHSKTGHYENVLSIFSPPFTFVFYGSYPLMNIEMS